MGIGLGPTELIILIILGLPILAGLFYLVYWLAGGGKSDDGSSDQ